MEIEAETATTEEPQPPKAKRRKVTADLSEYLDPPKEIRRYYAILMDLMEFKNNREYPNDYLFSTEELLKITPKDVYKFLALHAYGTTAPKANDAPKFKRSTTIKYYKKAISFFMPNVNSAWVVKGDGGEGNPTRSNEISRLLASIGKHETRGTGAESQEDRPFTDEEYKQLVDLLGSHGSEIDSLRHVAMLKFQVHLIARGDDTAHIYKNALKAASEHAGHLSVRVKWSKNVKDKENSPWQIILGALNTKYCLLTSLAIFLEAWIGSGDGSLSQWLFASGVTTANDSIDEQDKDCTSCKKKYQEALRAVLESELFTESEVEEDGKTGSHSVRKFGCTKARRCNCHKDEVDYRARWKNQRIQDLYTALQLAYPDAKCAFALCDGGACIYEVKEDLGLTDEWIAANIVPNIKNSFGDKVAAILGKAFLWACFDAPTAEGIPAGIRHNAISRFILLNTGLADDENPIVRVAIRPREHNGNVHFDRLTDEEVRGDLSLTSNAEWKAAVYSRTATTARMLQELQNQHRGDIQELKRENRKLVKMIQTLLSRPAVAAAQVGVRGTSTSIRADVTAIGDGKPAILSKGPQTLAVLWNEWQIGLDGSKPAREYTRDERGGKNKHRFCRRARFWRCMTRLIKAGNDVGTAIRRIQGVYGVTTVSKTLAKMAEHEGKGKFGHHLLQV